MQRYGVFSNAPNILQKSCSRSALGENNFRHTGMTYRNKPKGSWGDEDRPLLGTKQPPAIFLATKKWCCKRKTISNSWWKQKTERIKTENWMDKNRKLNGRKHGIWHTKDFDNHAKYSHICNQTGDWSKIGEFYISLFFNNLHLIGASMHLQKQCFKAVKACKLGCQGIDFEEQTTCYRMVNCMLLDQNWLSIAKQGAKKHPKRAEFL